MPRTFRETWPPTEWAKSRAAAVGVARLQEPIRVIGIESVLRKRSYRYGYSGISYVADYTWYGEWQ